MSILPLILCLVVFGGSLVYVLRIRASAARGSSIAFLSRMILTALILAFIGVIWYYTGVRFLESKTIERNVRIVSLIIFVILIPDIWIDDDEQGSEARGLRAVNGSPRSEDEGTI